MKNITTTLILLTLLLAGCAEDFLDIKRDKKQVIPTTIADYQAILDNSTQMNLSSSLMLNVIGGEEYTVTDDVWDLLSSTMQKNAYTWAKDVFEGSESDDWNRAYARILYANIALDGIDKLKPSPAEQEAWNQVKGTALFMRSYAFYQLVQSFAPPYNKETAAQDLGIPLRLEADITVPVSRANVQLTYTTIIRDLKLASQFLNKKTASTFRPSKTAVYALLSKTAMHMQDYGNAVSYADSCIALSEGLLNYNSLNTGLRYTFANMFYGENNPEVLYFEAIPAPTIVNSSRFIINPDLYNLFEEDDIRKKAFFYPTRGTYTFKGSYVGAYSFFGGLALDEIVLARAEAYARLNNLSKGLEDLNLLLKNRYKTSTYTDFTTTDQTLLINKIIIERRKELLCRGIRWEDLRRYNKEPNFQLSLSRPLKGQNYTLVPQSELYVWPIPDNVIVASGIEQNPR